MSYEVALLVQRLKRLGRRQGFLTYAQVNEQLPSEIVDPEKIEGIVDELTRAGIPVLEHAPDGDPNEPT